MCASHSLRSASRLARDETWAIHLCILQGKNGRQQVHMHAVRSWQAFLWPAKVWRLIFTHFLVEPTKGKLLTLPACLPADTWCGTAD
eukprot:21274-Chlamydomonas_euryale.AAC.7